MSPRILESALLLLRFRGRIVRRTIAEHAFVLFVLGPIVLGAVSWVLHRYLWALREPIARQLGSGAAVATDPLALGLALAFALAAWPGSLRELYGRARGGQDLVDTLPVAEGARLLASAIAACGRALVPAGCFLAAVATLATVDDPAWLAWIPVTVLALAQLALLDLLLASLLVRLGWASLGRILALGVGAVALLLSPWPVVRLVSWPFGVAGSALRSILEACLGVAGAPGDLLSTLPALVAALALTSALLVLAVVPFRRRDLEKGQALDRPAARGGPKALLTRLDGPTAAQARRDLLLVRRRFSPAVQIALALTSLAMLASILLGLDTTLSEAWRRQAMVCGLAVAVLGSVSVLPFLLKHQLPVFWIEKSTGVEEQQIWRTKIWLSVALAAPATLVGIGLVLGLAPGTAAEKIQAGLQLLASAGVLGTLVGMAAFEMPEEPLVSLVFSGFLGLAASALFVFYPQVWWLWVIFYGWIAGQLADRAKRRVFLVEVER